MFLGENVSIENPEWCKVFDNGTKANKFVGATDPQGIMLSQRRAIKHLTQL